MIIPLTWPQLQACRKLGTERHKEYLERAHIHSKHGHEVGMPPAGWLKLAEILQRKAFHPSGRHRKRGNQRDGIGGTRSALTRIWSTLVEARNHPALKGEAMMGAYGTVMLAWPCAGPRAGFPPYPDVHWSLFPVVGVEPLILVPCVETVQMFKGVTAFDQQVTRWRPQPVGSLEVDGAFLDPADHAGWDGLDIVDLPDEADGAGDGVHP